MSEGGKDEHFERAHPHPGDAGQESLFRFSGSEQPDERLIQLFVEARLYHSLPSQFNDPFEAKPHFSWPENAKDVKRIRDHLIQVAKEEGHNNQEAHRIVAQAFTKGSAVSSAVNQSIRNTLGRARICSFTSSKEHLLFWSHYADCHRGFCVEYDATMLPISYAFKVKYSEKYPEAIYPPPNKVSTLIPLLTKSKEWEYEAEFRTILVPKADKQPNNDGTSLILSGQEIKNVYFGALIDDSYRERLVELLQNGPFNPGLWQANLADSVFKVDFSCLSST